MKSYEIRALEPERTASHPASSAPPHSNTTDWLVFAAKMLQEIAAQLAERNEARNG